MSTTTPDDRHEAEMLEGYRDGLDLTTPEPNANRSNCYRHGFANGRDDRRGMPRATAKQLRYQLAVAIELDLADRAPSA